MSNELREIISQNNDMTSRLQLLELKIRRDEKKLKREINKLKEENIILKEKEHHKDTCCICLDEIECNKNIVSLHCEHKLHLPCFMNLVLTQDNNNSLCPLCRSDFHLDTEINNKIKRLNNFDIRNFMYINDIQRIILQILSRYSDDIVLRSSLKISEIKDKIEQLTGHTYTESTIKNNCEILVDGKRLNKYSLSDGYSFYEYNRSWK